MSAIRKFLSLFIALALLTAVAFAAQYRTSTVESDAFEITVSGAGALSLRGYQALRVPVYGAHIHEVFFSAGDLVSAGDLIATYTVEVSAVGETSARGELSAAQDDYDYELARRDSELADMRAQVESADGAEKRELELRIERAEMTRAKYDEQARAEIAALEAAYQSAQAAGQPRELRAGMDGVLLSIIDSGEDATLNPDRVIAEIYDPDAILISVDNVDGRFKYGMSVSVRLSSGSINAAAAGTVVSADNALPGALRTGKAYIALEPGYRQGNYSSATVTAVALSVGGALVARSDALTFSDGRYSARILSDDGTVRVRRVVKALENETEAWLFTGVSEGDKLIVK